VGGPIFGQLGTNSQNQTCLASVEGEPPSASSALGCTWGLTRCQGTLMTMFGGALGLHLLPHSPLISKG
jgi:hypothetical protein